MDIIDVANEKAEVGLNALISNVLEAAAKIPKGTPGECRFCGDEHPRLVGGACCRCRDRRGLP